MGVAVVNAGLGLTGQGTAAVWEMWAGVGADGGGPDHRAYTLTEAQAVDVIDAATSEAAMRAAMPSGAQAWWDALPGAARAAMLAGASAKKARGKPYM